MRSYIFSNFFNCIYDETRIQKQENESVLLNIKKNTQILFMFNIFFIFSLMKNQAKNN